MYSIIVPHDIDDVTEYLKNKIKEEYSGEECSFLLNCADWQPSKDYKREYIPYSPILCKYRLGSTYWPIYEINLKFSETTEINFISWKGDYESKVYTHNPSGNLGVCDSVSFRGDVYTRGY